MRKIARSGLKTVVRQQHSRLNSVSYNTARQARHFSYSSLSFRGEISNSVQNNFESDQVTKISTASLQNNINNNSTTTTTTTEVEEPGYKPSVAYPQGHYTLPHPIWTPSHASKVHTTKHKNKEKISDWLAYLTIKTIRFNFDWLTGYAFKKHPSTQDWVNRLIFLETIAGVPGSVAGSLRHLKSLRSMRRDFGWIHTLLEEAENERMHLLSFLVLKENKTRFFRGMVMLSQGVFYNFYWLSYILFPGFCHRLVGYLEEEAVTTYTKLLQHES
eukprot:TRINITY_DN590_c0_g1_i2.p1 TRINITY_DN590_c0_g1~~TRINITY_DN590_c0_g1_i2.p1  ORF type:complete len:273 (-),score=54.45 TRINITY_DN590_c0_g1_i2:111-929(-)